MKILIINDHGIPQGGADRIAIEMAKSYEKCGHNVEFFSIEEVGQNYENSWRNVLKNLFNFQVLYKLRSVINKFKPDLIFLHSWTKQLSASCILGCKGQNLYIVAHDYFLACPNGGQFNYKHKQLCRLKGGSLSCHISNCDKQSYVNKIYRLMRFNLQRLILMLSKPKIICLNELQIEMLSERGMSCLLRPNEVNYIGVKSSKCVGDKILYVGRSDPEKGLSILFNLAKNVNLNFELIGVKPSECDLELKNIAALGWKNPNEVLSHYATARLLLFPSKWLEVDPLVPLEACSRGIPVYCNHQNVFSKTLIKYGLDEFVFANENELLRNIEKIYSISALSDVRNKFQKIYQNEKIIRKAPNPNDLVN
jgi:glycosyltransferase involved in cell wall biosynthesis